MHYIRAEVKLVVDSDLSEEQFLFVPGIVHKRFDQLVEIVLLLFFFHGSTLDVSLLCLGLLRAQARVEYSWRGNIEI